MSWLSGFSGHFLNIMAYLRAATELGGKLARTILTPLTLANGNILCLRPRVP